jgi:hypothetical protein
MGILMKTLFIACVFSLCITSNLLAENLKDDLIRIHATLIPKIMMMDYDFKKRLVNNEIFIAVVYKNAQQKNDALALKRYMKAKYPNGFQNHKISLEFISFKNIHLANKHSLYYILPSSEKEIKDAIDICNKQDALSFSYNFKDLKYGVILSVKITNKVKPVINVDALKKTQITVRPVLLKVAEIYFQTSRIMIEKYDKHSLYIV